MKNLKRNTAILLSALAISCCFTTLAACGQISTFHYDNEDQYSIASDAVIDKQIESLHVCWIEGSIKVEYHDDNNILIQEGHFSRKPNQDETMRFWVDGTMLRIQYAKSGIKMMNNISKSLTIILPNTWKTTVETQENCFKLLDFQTISADITAESLATNDLSIDTVSGDIQLSQMFVKDDTDIKTVSGDVDIQFSNTVLDEFSAETVSGEIEIAANQINDVEIDTVSGNVHYTAAINADCLEIEGVSSTIYLNVFNKSNQ